MSTIQQLFNNPIIIIRLQILLITLFLLLIGLDIYLALDSVDDNTISSVILNNTDNGLFILTYFWGALATNFFFPKKGIPLVSPMVGTIIMVVIAFIVAFFDLGKRAVDFMNDHQIGIYKYSVAMFLGIIVALVFWRQTEDTIKAIP